MKIFISWSGELSHSVALALRDWLPLVLQAIQPYVSSEDIESGARWSEDIAKELQDSSIGIICVTRSNVDRPWINYEAGALSKALDTSRVIPFLVDMKKSALQGPLLQFQAVAYDRADFKRLIGTLNAVLGENKRIQERILEQTFDAFWPVLNDKINESKSAHENGGELHDVHTEQVSSDKILEEILDLVRRQQKVLNTPAFQELATGSRLRIDSRVTFASELLWSARTKLDELRKQFLALETELSQSAGKRFSVAKSERLARLFEEARGLTLQVQDLHEDLADIFIEGNRQSRNIISIPVVGQIAG